MGPRLGVWLAVAVIGLAGCGSSSSSNVPMPSPTPIGAPSPSPSPTSPSASHVVLVVLENHSFQQVIGSPAMPYLNSLASQQGLATNYFANAHPSISNYFMLTTGDIQTRNDNFSGVVTAENVVRAVAGAGKTWKAYLESLPSAGYTGSSVYPYFKAHNPFAFLSDVLDSSLQAGNMVPFTQLAADLSAASLPSFAFILPNLENDAHDCPGGGHACQDSDKLAAADNWLKANIDPVLTSPAFAGGVLIITWDEGEAADVANGGGQVATVVAGMQVKPGFRSTTLFQHQSVLKLILDLLSVGDHPGASATAPSMAEFFQ